MTELLSLRSSTHTLTPIFYTLFFGMGSLPGLGGLIAEAIWMLALYDCYQNEPDRQVWLWILMVGNFPAAIIYFVIRRSLFAHLPMPTFVQRWTNSGNLSEAKFGVKHIGNAYHYVKLGSLQYDLANLTEAESAFTTALQKEPQNPEALWGIARIAMDHRRWADARAPLEALLKMKPEWSAGEASLAYIRVLINIDDLTAAEKAIQSYLYQWSDSEARFYKARLLLERGEAVKAREELDDLIEDALQMAPFQFRRCRRWVKAAIKLKKELKTKENTNAKLGT